MTSTTLRDGIAELLARAEEMEAENERLRGELARAQDVIGKVEALMGALREYHGEPEKFAPAYHLEAPDEPEPTRYVHMITSDAPGFTVRLIDGETHEDVTPEPETAGYGVAAS